MRFVDERSRVSGRRIIWLALVMIVLGACNRGASDSAETGIEPADAIAERAEIWREVLGRRPPVLPLDGLSEAESAAQSTALADERFLTYAVDDATQAPLRSEVMSVRPVLPSDLTDQTAACADAACYRVELYNYGLNLTSVATVLDDDVLHVVHLPNTFPDIPTHLAEIAITLAQQDATVQSMLGEAGAAIEPTMANIKTALNGTRCERSQHLCVAPTFILQDGRALWAIVDLTDLAVVGVRWTELGASGAPVVYTERTLQDELVFEQYCENSVPVEQNGWMFEMGLTATDGLEIRDVRFEERPVLHSAKTMDWHVNYSREDAFGYSDSTGCPLFGAAAVAAWNGPVIEPLEEDGEAVGFAVIQDFRHDLWPQMCNYRYEQRFEFYDDGRLRVVVANLGRGCGDDGTYRPIVRIAPSVGETDVVVDTWDGTAWDPVSAEGWWLQPEMPPSDDGFSYRLQGPDAGYYIALGDGDNAYTYISRRVVGSEGEADLNTMGNCCIEGHEQGPIAFVEPPEQLDGGEIVFWYVPQLENNSAPGSERCWADTIVEDGLVKTTTWPCEAGPTFVPLDE